MEYISVKEAAENGVFLKEEYNGYVQKTELKA